MKYLVLGLYIAMLVCIAIYSRKKTSTLNDFLLAGEGLGGWLSAFAYGATYFSTVVFIGFAGKFGGAFGLAAIWIGIGNALVGTLLAWKVLAKRTKRMTTNLKVKTMPEYFEARYDSKYLKLFASIIIFVFLIPYSASIYQGLGYLFEAIMGIDFLYCVLIIVVLTSVYLFFGGYFATALSDVVQGIIMVFGVIFMTFFVLRSEEVSYNLSQLATSGKGFFPAAGDDLLSSPLFNIIILVLLTSFGIWGLPQSVHKFYAVKNESAIKKGMIVSTIFAAVIGCLAYFVGSLTNFFDQAVLGTDKAVPDMLLSVLPSGLLGLIVVIMLAVSMSTLSSLSLAGSSAVTIDIYKGYVNKNASDKKINWMIKIVCLCFVILSGVLAIFEVEAIVTLMGLSWGTIAGCFIGPYVFGLYCKNPSPTKTAVWVSMISGLVTTFVCLLIFGYIDGGSGFFGLIAKGVQRSPLIGVISMLMNVALIPVISVLTKGPNKEVLDKAFKGINEK